MTDERPNTAPAIPRSLGRFSIGAIFERVLIKHGIWNRYVYPAYLCNGGKRHDIKTRCTDSSNSAPEKKKVYLP